MISTQTQKGFITPGVIALLALVLVVGGALYFNSKPEVESMKKEGDAMTEKGGEVMIEDGEAMIAKDMVIVMNALNASGQTGKATFSDVNGKTKVVVEIPSGSAGVPQPSHIHTGTCSAPGAILYPLSVVVNGKAETILDMSLETLGSKLPLLLMVHKSKDEVKTFVSCGDIASVTEKDGEAMMEKSY